MWLGLLWRILEADATSPSLRYNARPPALPTLNPKTIACAYLATPFARRITGGTIYVDGGANIRAG